MPYDLLATQRVNTIMREVRDARELPQNLLLLNRTPITDATDGEMTAYWDGNTSPADIIADGQRALVYSTGAFSLKSDKIPNIKAGEGIDAEMLQLMERIQAGGGFRDDTGVINAYMTRVMERRLRAVRMTMEIMRIGAFLDSLTWNRGGVQFSISFNKPSDLKVTVSNYWTDATNGTPIADIQTHMAHRREQYGENTTRLTMTSADFRYMIATTEFRNKATLYAQMVLPSAASFPIQDIGTMQNLAGRILGLTIELHDAKYAFQNADGSTGAFGNYWPAGYVGFSDAASDNDPNATDFGNTTVTESIVAGLTGTNFAGAGGTGGFGGPVKGPVGYVTLSSFDLNAPGVTAWGVARTMPRVFRRTAESYLKVQA